MAHRLESLTARRYSLSAVLLAVLIAASLLSGMAWLGQPCRSPCRSAADHVLIFDEAYYVNAARVIAGVHPPPGSPYESSPLGVDPNSEHPQLAKVLIAGQIELFGDGPWAWRLGSVLLGAAAILGLFLLVRAMGGSPWLALGAAALMASDNLMLVHARIATLDVYALAAMIYGALLYVRRRPQLAGLVIGVGACAKLVTLYVLLAMVLLELLRVVDRAIGLRPALIRLARCAAATGMALIALLWSLDRIAPPFDASADERVSGGPFGHLGHMFSYAAHQTSPHGPRGIASYPWQWLFDYKPITYLNVNPARPADGLYHVHPAVHFIGVISPAVMLLALPALALSARRLLRQPQDPRRELDRLGLAWFAGTFLPFVALSAFLSRTSYLYYMLIVLPGIYIAVASLVARAKVSSTPKLVWIAAVLGGAIVLYPFTPLP